MRVFAIGDTHLRAGDRRDAARLRSLDQILAAAQQEQPDLIVWPGDLFDKTSTIVDRNHLRAYVKAFAAICPVLMVKGNHDAPGDGDIFGDLRAAHDILFVTTPQVVHVRTKHGTVAVAAMPYPEESGLVAAGIVPADIHDAAAHALDAIFMQLGHELVMAPTHVTLFIGHANLVGARASTGQPLTGAEISLRPEHLARLGDCPKILNHIHAPQDVHGATYVGSIASQDWGEREAKRYLVLEHSAGVWRIESRRLDTPALFHVEGIATRDGFTDWVVKDGADGAVVDVPSSWAGHEVRCRFRFAAADAGLLDQAKAQILATFAEAAHLELEPVAIAEREVRAPQVVAAKTLREKLDAWTAAVGLPTCAGVQVKLAALESTDPAALLAGIQAQLQAPVRVQEAA